MLGKESEYSLEYLMQELRNTNKDNYIMIIKKR